MTAIHAALFVLSSCCLVICVITAAEVDKFGTVTVDFNKQSNVLDALKSDLRRDNDDYVESTQGTINITNPYLLATTSQATEESFTTASTVQQLPGKFFFYTRDTLPTGETEIDNADGRRKIMFHESAGKNSLSEEVETNETKIRNVNGPMHKISPVLPNFSKSILNITAKTHRQKKLTADPRNGVTPNRAVPVIRSKASTKWKDRKEKVASFKNFVKKNKAIFSEMVKGARAQRAESLGARLLAAETPRGAREGAAREGGADDPFAPLLPLPTKKRPDYKEAEEALQMRFRAGRPPPLTPDQLDMAPAKGAQIHRMRLKGRLCQRSVLIPEGPKYNSKGQVYLQAYGHREGRDYRLTRRPPLLLPRCCNCCKKSVLGCE